MIDSIPSIGYPGKKTPGTQGTKKYTKIQKTHVYNHCLFSDVLVVVAVASWLAKTTYSGLMPQAINSADTHSRKGIDQKRAFHLALQE